MVSLCIAIIFDPDDYGRLDNVPGNLDGVLKYIELIKRDKNYKRRNKEIEYMLAYDMLIK